MSPMQEQIDQFVLEASRIQSNLDKISRRDAADLRATAVETGKRAYQELLDRQQSLALSAAEASVVQSMLDGIRARLRFLS